ncbi:MAG: hypothetical protein ABSD78_20230, partial [Acidimicrobiales bacterium]
MVASSFGGVGEAAGATGSVIFSETFADAQINSSEASLVAPAGTFTPCLTASSNTTETPIPGCTNSTNSTGQPGGYGGTLPDTPGQGALRLTSNGGNSNGYILYNYPIPTSAGLDVKFNQYQYDGTGADGITFFLSNGADPLTQIGPSGGSGGYDFATDQTATDCPASDPDVGPNKECDGLPYGILGVGLDAYGNYSYLYNDTIGTGSGACNASYVPTARVPEEIALRGPGYLNNTQSGYPAGWYPETGESNGEYCLLSKPYTATGLSLDDAAATRRYTAAGVSNGHQIEIQIDPPGCATSVSNPCPNGSSPQIRVYVDGASTPVVTVPEPAVVGTTPTVKFGWSASTGGQNEIHEINDVSVSTVLPISPLLSESAGSAVSVTAGSVADATFTTSVLATGAPEDDPVSALVTIPGGASGLSFVAGQPPTGSGWVCPTPAVGATTDTCTYTPVAPIEPGTSLPPITVPLETATANATGGFVPDAAVSSADNASTSGLLAIQQLTWTSASATAANVSISKSSSNSSPADGAEDTYTISAQNNGPVAATGVVVTDPLPTGLVYVSSLASIGTVSEANVNGIQTVTWTIGTMSDATSGSLAITVEVDASSGTIINTATETQTNTNLTGTQVASTAITPTSVADVTMTKTVATASPADGSQDTYTLTVLNGGPAPAQSVVVTDPLPNGLTYDSSTPSAGTSASASGSTVTWTIGTLAANTRATLTITVTVTSGSGSIVNTATETQSSSTPDPSGADSTTASATITPTPVANVVITKTVSNSAPTSGSSITYTLTVTNNGPDSASTVAVSDPLPTGVTETATGTPSQGTATFNNVSDTLAWTVGTLADGASATETINVTVNNTGVITNTATETQSATTPNSAGGTTSTGSVTINATQFANVTLTKTASNSAPADGGSDSYTLTVSNSNTSSSSAASVVVTDPLPNGDSYVSTGTPPSGTTVSEADNAVTWTVGTLAVGASLQLVINVTVTGATAIVNTATETQSSTTPDSSGATSTSASATITPTSVANVLLQKSAGTLDPAVGSQEAYTLTVTGEGPDSASGVVVTDPLPTGVTYVSTGTAPTGTTVSESGGTVTWTITNPLPDGTSFSLTVNATVNVSSGSITNTATETQSSSTPNSSGGTSTQASATINPTGVANVTFTKTVSNATPVDGSTDTYTLTVDNTGPDAAQSVVVTDPLPTGVNYLSTGTPPTGTTVSESGGTVTWMIGTLGISSSVQLTINVTVTANSGTIINTATETQSVSTPNSNGTISQNAQASISPGVGADVVINKTASSTTPTVGSQDTFTITVTNSGPDSTAVSVSDPLPAGLAYVSSSSATGTIGDSGQTVTWTIANLTASGAGSSATAQIVVTVNTSS